MCFYLNGLLLNRGVPDSSKVRRLIAGLDQCDGDGLLGGFVSCPNTVFAIPVHAVRMQCVDAVLACVRDQPARNLPAQAIVVVCGQAVGQSYGDCRTV